MSLAFQATFLALHRFIVGTSLWKPTEERGLELTLAISLYINNAGNTPSVGTATPFGREDDAGGAL